MAGQMCARNESVVPIYKLGEFRLDVQKLLESMTLREKLMQMTQLSRQFFSAGGVDDVTGPMRDMKLSSEDVAACGTLVNGIMDAAQSRALQDEHLAADPHKIPLLFMMDVIHGYRTIFPIPLALGATWDTALVERAMSAAAREAASAGRHATFSPLVDLVRDARWGRGREATGEDPYLNGLFARAFVRGYQGSDLRDTDRVAACVKHVAAYGAAEAGREYNTVDMSEYSLHEYYFPAYKAAVDEGVAMAMTSFNALNGVPSTGNEWLMRDILRGLWGFDGVLISDWGAIHELTYHSIAEDGREAARKALRAGVDIEMMTPDYIHFGEELVQSGAIDERLIDEAVLRILRLKEKLGLFGDPYHGASPEREARYILCEEHHALARETAARACVLLKNEGNTLPLDRGAKVAVIGPYADSGSLLGSWSCRGKAEDTVTLAQGLGRKTVQPIQLCKGVSLDGNDTGMAEAVAAAREADVIILAVGERADMSGEASSRVFIELPETQQRLAEAVLTIGKPTVAVLFNGRPLDLRWLSEKADAVLEAWFPGTEGGNAVADVLFGDALPQGRLTMSMPYSVGQLPLYYNHFRTGRPLGEGDPNDRYKSFYIDAPNAPLYPFGYGLGFSPVEYGGLRLSGEKMGPEGITATVTVKNVGTHPVIETAQLYIRDVSGSVVRPVRELKDFRKVALAPGEAAEVCFTIREEMLKFHHPDGSFYAEPGAFQVFVGGAAAAALRADFRL